MSNTLNFLKFLFTYFLCLGSQETEILLLPFDLLFESTFLPFGEDILSLNPCLLRLFLLDG
jgi:hypothetical protein